MDVEKNLISILERKGINYERTTHKPVYTSEQASEVRGVPLDTGVKAMVLERDESELILGLVPANYRIDLSTISNHESSEIKLADPDDVFKQTGCEIGSVPPFGHRNTMMTYLDPEVLEKEKVNFNAGKHDVSVQIDSKVLPACIEASGARLKIIDIKE